MEPAQPERVFKKPQDNLIPVHVAAEDLGPFRFGNFSHGPRGSDKWTAGSGIGQSQLFVGFPGNVGAFGIHAESVGADFVNVVTESRAPVLWTFIPHNAANNRALATIQVNLDEYHFANFYKGAMLAKETMDHFGFQDVQLVRQHRGEVMMSHAYHFGLGMEKIAEAHTMFSAQWEMLFVSQSNELPICTSQPPEWWIEEKKAIVARAAGISACFHDERSSSLNSPRRSHCCMDRPASRCKCCPQRSWSSRTKHASPCAIHGADGNDACRELSRVGEASQRGWEPGRRGAAAP
jgi:hypothetical protein